MSEACQAAGSVGTCKFGWQTVSCDGEGARIAYPLTTTMLRSAPRITRPTVRLLADQKFSHNSTLLNTRSLYQRPAVHPSLVSRNLTPTVSTSTSASRPPTQTVTEGLQARPFASTSRNSTRHLRSDDRHRRGVVNRPLVGTVHGDLPRKNRKANPFLPFQASSFVDAFVTTIVGVGISELCKHKHIELKLNQRSYSFRRRNCVPGVVQMEGPRQGTLHVRPPMECRC